MAEAPQIKLGRDGRKSVYLDVPQLLKTRMLVQANSGAGKSYAVRVLAEQSMHHVQTIVIDPDGEFASLRELHDVLLVGDDGDLPADPLGATLLALRLFEKRCSAVIDLYELDPDDREIFVRDFFASLLTIPREEAHPMLVILDEAQDFCPERSMGTSVSTQAVISLMTRGRKRGIGLCLASQRMSGVSKSASSPANNYLFGRTVQDTDRNRVARDLGLEKADRDGLRNLEEGQFWALGPAFSHKDCRKIRVAEAETTHPEVGAAMPPPPPASKRIRTLIGREFSDLPERAKEEAATVREATTALRRLEKENADLRKKLDRVDPDAERRLRGAQDELDRLVNLAAEAVEDIDRAKERLVGVKAAPSSALATPSSTPVNSSLSPSPAPTRRSSRKSRSKPKGSSSFPPDDQKLLDSLAWLEGARVPRPHRRQLAWVLGIHPRNNTYEKRLSKMKNEGWVHYPDPGYVQLTDRGRPAATAGDVPPTSAKLQEMVYAKLSSRRAKLLRVLVEQYPADFHRTECAEVLGIHPRNNGYEKDLGAMRTVGLVTYPGPGRVRAGPMMFLN